MENGLQGNGSMTVRLTGPVYWWTGMDDGEEPKRVTILQKLVRTAEQGPLRAQDPAPARPAAKRLAVGGTTSRCIMGVARAVRGALWGRLRS